MREIAVRRRSAPLAPEAVLSVGSDARALAKRLLELNDSHLGRLRGLAGVSHLAVLGKAADLPWCDGIQYLGREPEVPGLLTSCVYTTAPDAALLARALLARFASSRLEAPYAVCFEPPLVVPLASARALTRSVITTWLDDTLMRQS